MTAEFVSTGFAAVSAFFGSSISCEQEEQRHTIAPSYQRTGRQGVGSKPEQFSNATATASTKFSKKLFNVRTRKPIDEDDLETALRKFKERQPKPQDLSLDFETIKRMLVNPVDKQYKKRFTVKIGQQLKVIPIDEVECFFSENKGTYLHTLDNRNYLLDITLEQLETELDPKDFYRVSRKFIIPMKAVKEIILYSNSRLKVILPTFKEEEVIVSRERVSDFKDWIG